MFLQIANYNGQNADNLLKIRNNSSGCCGAAGIPCQYSVVIPTANAVNNIKITRNGATETLTTGFPATGATNVKAAIKAALAASGFENDDDVVAGVTSETSGTNTIYRITGDVVVASMTHNTSTVVAATTLCTRVRKCVYELAWAGNSSSTTFTINGVDATLGALTYAGKTAAEVQAAIIALANFPSTATINVVKANNVFTIDITDVFDSTYTLDGNDFTEGNCAMGYTA